MDRIIKFLACHTPPDLVDKAGLSARRLGRMRATLQHQWGLMDAAWYNHNPADGNVGVETLAKRGRTVEATRMAVAHVLQISGDALEIEQEADLSAFVTTDFQSSQELKKS